MSARSKGPSRGRISRLIVALCLCLVAGLFVWTYWVYSQIERYAALDEAAPADAIAVFGAAEYDGKPSPVFRARLDHAFDLYNRGIAHLIVTLGGDGGDQYSEGQVGRDYLVGLGVSDSDIIAETHSRSTEESANRLAVIARTNHLSRIVVVSDATHLFRIHELCAADGMNVLTSPRLAVPVEGGSSGADRVTHEILSYTLWRLHLH
jgi:uncharacterized SAM-binding protein YcdF (DUF218 family)